MSSFIGFDQWLFSFHSRIWIWISRCDDSIDSITCWFIHFIFFQWSYLPICTRLIHCSCCWNTIWWCYVSFDSICMYLYSFYKIEMWRQIENGYFEDLAALSELQLLNRNHKTIIHSLMTSINAQNSRLKKKGFVCDQKHLLLDIKYLFNRWEKEKLKTNCMFTYHYLLKDLLLRFTFE